MATMIGAMDQPSLRSSEQHAQVVMDVPGWWWGVYLAVIVGAELIIALQSVELGVGVHLLLLFAMPLHATFVAPSSRALLTVMLLVPIIRIASLAMPIADSSPVQQYLLASLPLAVALPVTMQVAGLKRREIGLRLDRLPQQVAIGLLGLPIGALMYAILQPAPAIPELRWGGLVPAVIAFLLAIGFLEELIFRGVLQNIGQRALREWGIVYVSAVFAALHIGYLSPPHTGLVFLVGMVFGWLAVQTRSLIGVAVAHGVTNVVLYLVFPLILVPGGWAVPDVSWTGYVSTSTPGRPIVAAVPAVDQPRVGVGPTPVSRSTQTLAAEPSVDVGTPAAPAAVTVSESGLAVAPPVPEPVTETATAPSSATPRVEPIFRPSPMAPALPARPVFLPPPPLVQATSRVSAAERVRVIAVLLNVRAQPTLDAEILTRVPEDSILDVVGADQEGDELTWRNVRLDDGQVGWVSGELVETVSPTAGNSSVPASEMHATPPVDEAQEPANTPIFSAIPPQRGTSQVGAAR